MRLTQPFPNAADGIAFPKKPESYRIVSVFFLFTCGAVTPNNATLRITDGAANVIMEFFAKQLTIGQGLRTTFAACSPGSGENTASSTVVPIPDDLWIQPQWSVQLLVNVDPTATLTLCVLQTEQYAPAKTVAPKPRSGQDAPP